MIAAFDGQDYLIILDKSDKELDQLIYKNIESGLQSLADGNDLGKKVILEFFSNTNVDGIELTIHPRDRKGWDDIKEIRVQLNKTAYDTLKTSGKCGTRYTSSNCIEIYDGQPQIGRD